MEPDLTDRQYQTSLQSDAELLDLYVLGGQTQALLTLLSRFTPMMTHVIRRVVSHNQDSEDAFQATCVVLMQSARKIRSKRSVAAWLYGVAYRTACRVRSKSRRQATGIDAMELADSRSPEDPIGKLVREIELSNLDRELQELPEIYREPLIEHYILGLTARQIAERMELSNSAVEGRLRRGRQMLRERLAERGASLSVCVAGVAWMRDHQQTATTSQQLNEHFVQSPAFRFPQNLSEHDPYLFELVTGESQMKVATLFKSVGFFGTVAFATVSLSLFAIAVQFGNAKTPGNGTGNGTGNAGGVQAVAAEDDPTVTTTAIVEAKKTTEDANNLQPARTTAKTVEPAANRSTSEVIQFVKPSTPPPSWLLGGQTEQNAAEEVRDRLRERTELDFVAISLNQAIEWLTKEKGVQIVIDQQSLEDSGVSADQPITLRVKDLPLNQSLSLMLKPMHLTYEVHPDLVRIVSENDVELAVRYYDLSHVLPSSAGLPSLIQSAQFLMDVNNDERVTVVGSMFIARASEKSHRAIEKLLAEVAKLPPENLPANYAQAQSESAAIPIGGMGGGMGGMGGGMGGLGGGMF